MEKRKYTHIREKEKEILAMRGEGKSHREIAEELGVEKAQIKEFLKRHRRKEAALVLGATPRPKGRPRKTGGERDIVAEQVREIKQLKMENALLRDFVESTERK